MLGLIQKKLYTFLYTKSTSLEMFDAITSVSDTTKLFHASKATRRDTSKNTQFVHAESRNLLAQFSKQNIPLNHTNDIFHQSSMHYFTVLNKQK